MNTIVTSEEAILTSCRVLVAERGVKAINMRAVAERCHVALGSLYHYFPSKEALLAATITSIWQEIFQPLAKSAPAISFADYVDTFYKQIQQSAKEYPNFFLDHSMSFTSNEKGPAKETMDHYLEHMKADMERVLNQDQSVKSTAFNSEFTKKDFLDYCLNSLLTMLVIGTGDCHVLLELINRSLY